jgi:signal transduction histidine kinase
VDLREFRAFLHELAGEDAEQAVIDSFREQFDSLFKHLATIRDGTDRIKGIVRDLQAFTRHDSAGQKTVSIVDCLRSTMKLVRAKYRETTEFVEAFDIDPQIECWPAQLNQVFMNLLVNACQAVDEYQLKADNGRAGQVTIRTYAEEGNLVIAFVDNGIGMDEATQSKLFEPFFTTKDVGEGTGLGLSISFGIVRKHDGIITVESTLGEGSTFAVKLPLLS